MIAAFICFVEDIRTKIRIYLKSKRGGGYYKYAEGRRPVLPSGPVRPPEVKKNGHAGFRMAGKRSVRVRRALLRPYE